MKSLIINVARSLLRHYAERSGYASFKCWLCRTKTDILMPEKNGWHSHKCNYCELDCNFYVDGNIDMKSFPSSAGLKL